jgi:DNA helicase-2/ATP-dependent DNA helicase PcrA
MSALTEDHPLLAGLNEQQIRAVTAPTGPTLVIAGPGSGKTRVLTHRIAWLLDEYEADPSEILAVTFTNKAAREMRERLDRLVGRDARGLTVGTFHSVCARILRRDGGPVGLGPDFVIYDDDDQLRLLRQAITEIGLDDKQYSPRTMQNMISGAKNTLLSPAAFTNGARKYIEEVAGRVYRRYQELLEWNQAADFDDLLAKTVELFSNHPDVLARYQERWRYVLVDEYQDTNQAQYTIIRLLTQAHRSLFVVGDEDQGIYSWRAADITNILNFERDYPDATVMLLEQNYRSTQAILDVAMHVIGGNQGRRAKTLWTDRAGGIPVQVREAYDEGDEAQYICREITRLIAAHGYRHNEIAVMYRTNAQSRTLEESFIRFRIPHVLVGGTRFYERKEIRDVLAYLRLVHNPYDTASLRRVLEQTHSGKGVGKGTIAALETYATAVRVPLWDAVKLATAPADAEPALFAGSAPAVAPPKLAGKARAALQALVSAVEELRGRREDLPLAQLIDTLLARTGYAQALSDGSDEGLERLENAKELISVAQDYSGLDPKEALASFLEEVALLGDLDRTADTTDAVTLITLHAAKGLEYKVVFIAGMEEGLLPHSRSLDQPRALEEECRLAYVGVTRAMERLYISYAFHRTIFGATQTNEPSRFLQSAPGSLVAGFLPPSRAGRRSGNGAGAMRPQPRYTQPGVPQPRRESSAPIPLVPVRQISSAAAPLRSIGSARARERTHIVRRPGGTGTA